jgi:hypothetical protein
VTVDALPALLIGAVVGDSDSESMAWSRAIGALSREVERLSADLPTLVRLNVVYHVDGRVAPNEFDGVRIGRYNKATLLLEIQAAVPARMPDKADRLLMELLDAAITAAEAFTKTEGIAEDLPTLRSLVRKVAGDDRASSEA